MAYQRSTLVAAVIASVQDEPLLPTGLLASRLGVHRHTLAAALRAEGQSMAIIRERAILQRLEAWASLSPPAPLKAAWTGIGFSSASSFARYIRRATGMAPNQFAANLRNGQPVSELAQAGLDPQIGKHDAGP